MDKKLMPAINTKINSAVICGRGYIATLCLRGIKHIFKLPQTAGKFVGKKVGKRVWNKELEVVYNKYHNNIIVTVLIMLGWLSVFWWLRQDARQCFILLSESVSRSTAENLLSIGYFIFVGGLFCLCLEDIKRVIVWNTRENLKKQISECVERNDVIQLKNLLLAQKISCWQKAKLAEQMTRSKKPKDILRIYEHVILDEKDREADKIIAKYAHIAGLGSTVSPKWSWEYILTIFSFIKMLLEIAKVYEIKLSVGTFLMLFLLGLASITAAVAITNSIKLIIDKNNGIIAVTGGMGAWLISQFIKFAIPCCAISIIGYAMQYTLRPLYPHVKY